MSEEITEITKEFLESIIDEIPMPFAVKDSEHRWILINRVICDMFQMEKEELLGKTDHDIIQKEEADIFRRNEEEVFRTGRPNLSEEMVTEKNGRRRWQVADKSLIRDKYGDPYLLCISYDITERRRAQIELQRYKDNLLEMVKERTSELRNTHSLLLQSQKMDALGQLAGGTAHEFNNIIAVIMGTVEFMKSKKDENDPDMARLERVIKACNRGGSLTSRLLSFARRDQLLFRKTDVRDIISEVTGILKNSVARTMSIDLDVKPGAAEIIADRNQITQALLNLCLNACDAANDSGGGFRIEVSRELLDTEFCCRFDDVTPGEYCVIRVTDTGPGIDEDIMERVFEPFFTTKEKEKGTGLGLSVTHGIVKSHNGMVSLENDPGGGAAASMYLPMNLEIVPEPGRQTGAPGAGPGGTLLLVDDEKDFLDAAREMLQANGYSVITAETGSKAVQIVQAKGDEISLVLLDAVMPMMDGKEVFDAISKMKKDIRVVVCSGHSEGGQTEYIMKNGGAAFVQKPCNMDKLLRTIGNVLEGRAEL